MRTIASKLGVANLLEGSVRKSGKALRITAKLIRASEGAHLWSQTYDRQLDDIFKVQNEIAGEVVKALKVSLLEGSLPNATGPKNTEAYTLYLQARSIYDHSGGAGANEDYAKVVDYLHQAIKLDAGFAPAWAYLSNVLSQQAAFGFVPSQKGYEDARRAVKEALRLDPMLPEAYSYLAKIKILYDWDWAGAQSNVRQALQLNPQNSAALNSAGTMFEIMGEPERAVELLKKAAASDTLSALRYSSLGWAEYSAGMLDDAQRDFLKALDLNPGFPSARYILGWVQIAKGNPTEALAEFERSSDEEEHLAGRALAYYAMGRKADADLALAEMEKKYAAEYAYVIAQIHAYRKEFDRAFCWLDRAYRQHELDCGRIKADPMFKVLRSDPRYKAFLRKMKLPE
jgi:tetratricopeptide (TPR) repeat protein